MTTTAIHSYDALLATLPASHRDRLSHRSCGYKPDCKLRMGIVEGLVQSPHLRMLNNMIQNAVAARFTPDLTTHAKFQSSEDKIFSGRLTAAEMSMADIAKTAIFDGYAPIIELLKHIRTDLAGDEYPYGAFLQHLETGASRRPFPEARQLAAKSTEHHPSRVSRVWMMAVNEDYQGGWIYFPTRRSAFQLQPGTAIIFSPKLPYGISPITKGVRRVIVGWATRHKPSREKLDYEDHDPATEEDVPEEVA